MRVRRALVALVMLSAVVGGCATRPTGAQGDRVPRDLITFEQIRERYYITDIAQAAGDDPAFSERIRRR